MCPSPAVEADFNPRSPHGERPREAYKTLTAAISTHAPRTGSDLLRTGRAGSDGEISTHAPRTGSDNP